MEARTSRQVAACVSLSSGRTLKHVPLTYRLTGKKLWTRDRAREPRAAVEALLDQAAPGEIVTVDLRGVDVFDFSFASELFGRLLQRLPSEHPGRFLVIDHLGPWTGPNLEAALIGLDLAAIVRDERGQYRLLGKVTETDRQTFDALLLRGGTATATDLAAGLDVNLTAMNERLQKLVRSGVLRREDAVGRTRFTYHTPN